MIIAGGYVATRPATRPPEFDARFVPDPYLTLCRHLAPGAPWVTWSDPGSEMQDFGVDETAAYRGWADAMETTGRLLWPGLAVDPDLIVELLDRFAPGVDDVEILGFGLDDGLVGRFLRDYRWQFEQDDGLTDILERGDPVDERGELLGYEPSGIDIGAGFHSWSCHLIQAETLEAVDGSVNQLGFVDDPAVALAASAYIGSDDVGAEPCPWYPLAVVRYPRR